MSVLAKVRRDVGQWETLQEEKSEMRYRGTFIAAALAVSIAAFAADVPKNLVVENIPSIPPELVEKATPYLESRSASLQSWHPTRKEMLISTRFGDTPQVHRVKFPGGAREQLTFYPDRVGGARYRPVTGDSFILSKDVGGGEFFQLYRFDLATGNVSLLTDGKSRNSEADWSTSGKRYAYTSTRRTGRDTDIYVSSLDASRQEKLLVQRSGGGWGVSDWSPDDRHLLIAEYISAGESYLHIADAETGEIRLLTPRNGTKRVYGGGAFSRDGKSIIAVTDEGAEFQRVVSINVASGEQKVIFTSKWDVEDGDLSADGKTMAVVTNEEGIGVLRLLDMSTMKSRLVKNLPAGSISGVRFHPKINNLLGFNVSSNRHPVDVYSMDLTDGKVSRWTESEAGGLRTSENAEAAVVRTRSFDGLEISGLLYRPSATKFSGKRPILINIHGGPEGQSRPSFLGRGNYLINELGIAVLFPNVRGSSGFGKTFLTLDNGFKREDSVRDIGAFIDWIKTQPDLDSDRIGVTGGSYGGYMTLAALTMYSSQLRAGIDVVGISSFITFLKNTQDYRRDLRRVEYGDERETAMQDHLQKISPLTNVAKIRKPLFVVQGFNDPRVPYTEAEQIAKAVRANEVPVWFLMAKDEGHGFAKKANQDYQFFATLLFLEEYLLK